MAVLDQLKITNAAPKKDVSPIGRFRRRLIEAIELQIEMAAAESSGGSLVRNRKKWVNTGTGGEKELRQVPIRLRRWWWKDESGMTFVTLKYGATPLELAPGKNAIEIGRLEELPTKLALICDAIRGGELDGCAQSMSGGRLFPKKPKMAAPLPKTPGQKG